MTVKISLKGIRPAAIIFALLCGLAGLAVMFIAGSWSGSGVGFNPKFVAILQGSMRHCPVEELCKLLNCND